LAALPEGTYNWTVGACSAASGLAMCSYQQQVRMMRLQFRTYVSVTMDRMSTRDSCDSVSPGDWLLTLALAGGGKTATVESSHLDVETGAWVPVNRTAGLEVAGGEPVTVAVAGVDCDNDGIWTLANVFDGIPGLIDVFTNWTQTCHGEEPHEASGDNDFAGVAERTFSAAQLAAFTQPAEVTLTSRGEHDCGRNTLRVRLRIQAVPR
jgi:hypothetical protein